MPINQHQALRSDLTKNENWDIHLVAPIQQVNLSILGKTFNLLLADGDSIQLKIQPQHEAKKLALLVEGKNQNRILLLEELNRFFCRCRSFFKNTKPKT